jgi:hypothetical protein
MVELVKTQDRIAEYDPDIDTFRIALDRVREQEVTLELPDKMFLYAAHEATHKVQFAHGENPRPSPQSPELDDVYDNDPHEREAWIEAMHAFKKKYPNANGSIVSGPNTFHIPPVSRYL